MAERGLSVAMLSLERWDSVWRRNQHLAHELVESGAVSSLMWISPPNGGLSVRAQSTRPHAAVEVVEPPLLVPRRFGGHRVLGRWLQQAVRGRDLLWVNDPVAGAGALQSGIPAVYDVTDDWRSMPQSDADRQRTIAAEDVLARCARTVVCSDVLADRWHERYGLRAEVIPNAVDVTALRSARPRALDGLAPHIVYVGTLHSNRVDVDLIAEAAAGTDGQIHLVGPDHLAAPERYRLHAAGVQLHGPVTSGDVPSWLVSADVLICPHLVDDFTLSLDAIKAHEYLATDRPIVATPSCGFQSLTAAGLTVVDRAGFAAALAAAARSGPFPRPAPQDWTDRAAGFAAVLKSIVERART